MEPQLRKNICRQVVDNTMIEKAALKAAFLFIYQISDLSSYQKPIFVDV